MSIAKDQAQDILDQLAFLPFEAGLPIIRNFRSFPELPGIYAVRHRMKELLYLGKTSATIRNRGNFTESDGTAA